ncbi:MAG: protein translocase subunit SecD [Acidobacteria bacterium]|nr:protein translocase subunit SecD [Acidobacteriota bacterium]
MDRTAKALIILGVIVLSIYGVVAWWAEGRWLGLPKNQVQLAQNLAENIRLGLDLRGGTHMILQVRVHEALRSEADTVMERLREELRKSRVDYASVDRNEPATIEEADSIHINVRGVPAARAGDLRGVVNERFGSWLLTAVNPTDYRLNLRPTEMIVLKKEAVERTIRTLERRINSLGLTEPVIQAHGPSEKSFQILVQLPGVDDPARVKQIMGTAAVLELSEVKDGPFASPEQARAKHGGVLPLNTKLVPEVRNPGETGQAWYLVNRTPVITGRDLRSARPGRDEFQKWETNFTLGRDGARRFGRFTEANVGNRLAIVLDNQVRSAPVIQNRIDDSGRITGAANQQDASDLSLVLQSGSLPAGIDYLEERTVGPSLGADSIRQGVISGLVALAMVITVMLVYYKNSGVNAVVALLLNGVITVAALSYFGAVWTLPGIAGFILSLGMAVDSNVLIFERIREELRSGKGVIASVEAGFQRAFVTIVDTHVVTVVSSAFLFMFGTGPVKGFAVTLVIGLIANVFTAVFVSRTMFDFALARQRQVTTLSI